METSPKVSSLPRKMKCKWYTGVETIDGTDGGHTHADLWTEYHHCALALFPNATDDDDDECRY
eukprot:scaffold134_cov151-Alexandrium_tamarense.AAC.2